MKKLSLPIMIIAIGVAFWEQQHARPRVYITAVAIAIFMYGMMQLSAKTPSKNLNNDDEHVI